MDGTIQGFSRSGLGRLDRFIRERYVDGGHLPGSLTCIYRGGELVHENTAGHIDLERGVAMRRDAIFRIYSMTKPVTAVALMMLVEDGLVSLNDDVAAHISGWGSLGVYASGMYAPAGAGVVRSFVTRPPDRPMKVVDLLTHTAGLTHGMMMRSNVDAAYRTLGIAEYDTPGGLDTMVEQLAGLPLEFSPGTAWNYSVSLDVAGYLVQHLSGLSFGEFLRRRLFEPLGMADTGFYCPGDKLDRLASCYAPKAGGGLVLQDDGQASSRFGAAPALESGGGGLLSTAPDYLRFCRMLLNRGELGGVRLLSPKTVDLFGLNHLEGGRAFASIALPGAFGNGYTGLGHSLGGAVTIDVAATRMPGTLGEYFWGGMAGTTFWIDPKEDLAVVFMTQLIGAEVRLPLRRQLHTLVYAAMTESRC